jgi:hypothetical protein
MPQSKYRLPSGDIITHEEVVWQRNGSGKMEIYKVNGVVQKRIVKGTAKLHRGGVAVTDNGRVFRLKPATWEEVTQQEHNNVQTAEETGHTVRVTVEPSRE